LRAQLRLYVNQTAFQMELNRVINASRLMWTYWNRTRSRWVPVASYIDEDGYLFCNTTSFSTWTVVEMVPLQIAGTLSEEEVAFGQTVTVSATVKDEEGNPVEGATVPVSIDQTDGLSLLSLSDLGNGNYGGTLDTGELGSAGGTYAIILTAEKEGYYPSQETLTLNVQPQPTDWTIYVIVGVVIVALVVIASILIRRS